MKEVTDPRNDRKKKHDSAEMLTYLVMGYLCGRISLRRAHSWAVANTEMLKRYMELKGGIASVSTLSRLLSGIDEEIFALVFSDWVYQLLNSRGRHIIIDGKALRAATKKIRNGNVPYLLNAIDAVTEMVIAQLPIEEKTNEITAIPKLLDWIEIRGNTVSIDAIGTQTAIMEKLDSQNAGFVLQVKKNQPQMYEDIVSFFGKLDSEKKKEDTDSSYHSPLGEELRKMDIYKTDEKNRERYEHRICKSCQAVDALSNLERMPYVKTIGVTKQIRRLIVKDSDGNDITPDLKTFLSKGSIKQPIVKAGDSVTDAVQEVGMISNRVLTAKELGEYKRKHWRIENGLHHVLDDAFREDRSPAKGSKNNLALIRKIAYNIIRYTLAKFDDNTGVIAMMDCFSDNPSEAAKYVFEPLESLN